MKYEGTWANGLQDGYGCETYSDGGYYQGQMCRGLRHGYGVRKSAPYGDSQLNNPNKNGQFSGGAGLPTSSILVHGDSLQSAGSVDVDPDDPPKPDDGFKPNIDRTLASKNGFVLVAKPLLVPMPSTSGVGSLFSSRYPSGDSRSQSQSNQSNRRSSLTNKTSTRIPGSSRTTQKILRGFGLRKQKSTSDLDSSGSGGSGGNSTARAGDLTSSLPFTLSPEELDITDPTTVETYTGEWANDKRNGHGVCERSDGLKYEGQWYNDTKCGYGVTTFKDGSKEEGKYKNNILIVDSRVKRFFQLGQTNIRQRIDEAVEKAKQAQSTALRKAEVADQRAANARDKSDQATTAALEALRDSHIACAVARQYSETQQQQQQQQHINMSMGYPLGGPLGNPAPIPRALMDPMGQMTNMIPMSPNPAGANMMQQAQRRISIAGQQNRFATNFSGLSDQHHLNQSHQHQIDSDQATSNLIQGQPQYQTHPHNQHSTLFTGMVDTFNGRRGSFRGGSVPPNTNIGSTTFGNQPTRQRSSADPFNDIFDHYKSSSSMAARRSLSKQASLDHDGSTSHHWAANQRASSVARQFAGDQSQGSRREKFRMSSMDHADENRYHSSLERRSIRHHPPALSRNPQQSLIDSQAPDGSMQTQLKHLVTSGEEIQHQVQSQTQQTDTTQPDQQGLTNELSDSGPHPQQTPNQHVSTPGNSPYNLPQSVNSSFYGQQTPSPDAQTDNSSMIRSGISANQQIPAGYYGQVVPGMMFPTRTNFPGPPMQQVPPIGRQRDVHSLAGDEHLYRYPYRQMESPLDRTDFRNYDFTIKSGPRPLERALRRTASLSRPLPHNRSGGGLIANDRRALDTSASNQQGDPIAIRRAGPSRSHMYSNDIGVHVTKASDNTDNSGRTDQAAPNRLDGILLRADSATSLSQGLIRKPSLQVRYDPIAMGGLMSREEVAALSHAQREQKRIEFEQAERRAKKPLLHIYLTLMELVSEYRFFLSILVVNVVWFITLDWLVQ